MVSSIVQKSRPMIALAESNFTLPEFKMMDAYLSVIDSHTPENRSVVWAKGELENLLEVDRIRKEDIKKRLHNLFQPVTLPDKDDKNHFKTIALFEEADCRLGEDGKWNVVLTCTEPAKKYIFNIENLGYIKYRLQDVIHFTSRKTYIWYMYLESYKGIADRWTVSLEYVRKILLNGEASYAEYKEFNKKVLAKVKKELDEKSRLSFEYEPVKEGKKIVKLDIRLVLKSKKAPSKAGTERSVEAYKADTGAGGLPKWMHFLENDFTAYEKEQVLKTLEEVAPGPNKNDDREILFEKAWQRFCWYQTKNATEGKEIYSKGSYLIRVIRSLAEQNEKSSP